MTKPLPRLLAWAATCLLGLSLNLHAQTAPVITTQPASQTILPGARVSLSVAVSGTGPFTYQWQFNGVNFPTNLITTVAGNGSAAFAGDGGPATSAALDNPQTVAADAFGNLYIADQANERVRKLDRNGIITTVAGNGSAGYTGDGNSATNASLNNPYGVAVDALGNLYIADSANERIRKVDTNGLITTVAGNGSAGYSGDGVIATNTSLNNPQGVAVDAAGNLYLADQANQRIRKVNTNGLITTVAGNGSPGTDYGQQGIPATSATLWNPAGVAVDPLGNLYIADWYNSLVREVDTNGLITTVAGNDTTYYCGDGTPAAGACLSNPQSVALDLAGNLYIADRSNQRIRVINTAGIINTIAGNGTGGYSGDGGAASAASLYSPQGVAVDAGGNLYIADSANNRIRAVGLNGPAFIVNNFSNANAGNYTVIVTSPYGTVTSAPATLTVAVPPAITIPPSNQDFLIGGGVTLTLTASGTAPLTYSWFFNTTNLIQTSTNASLVLSNLGPGNVGSYSVVITNAFGATTSSNVSLNVWDLADALNGTNLTWTTGGDAPWFVETTVTEDGLAATQSGALTIGQQSTLQTTVTGPGTLTFWWNVASTPVTDYLSFFVNGTESTRISGSPGWQSQTVYLGAGPQILSWTYAKTDATVTGLDAGFLDEVNFVAGGTPPFVSLNPTNQFVVAGQNATLTAAALGTPPLGYQWQLNALGLPGATNAALYLTNAQPANSGNYQLVITNAYGSVLSPLALLSVGLPPTVAVPPASQTNLAGTATSLSVTPGGTGPFTYQWQLNGTNLPNGLITNVAGNGANTFSGDGAAATLAGLNGPYAVAYDAFGNLYLSDRFNNRIREVLTSGLIITVAGNGTAAYAGDGGLAVAASLRQPLGLAFDPAGNLYIADSQNNRIRRLNPNGLITTVAGNGTFGFSGDGGPAVSASLRSPSGVACDGSGNLYIVDQANNRIREVTTNGVITSVATNTAFYFLNALALDGLGNLYLTEANSRVLRVAVNGVVTTVAGNGIATYSGDGGPATGASLDYPQALAFDSIGNLYISDSQNNRIRRVDPYGFIATVAGTGAAGYSGNGGPATRAALSNPTGVALDPAGNLVIVDNNNERVRKVRLSASYPTLPLNPVSATNAGNYSVVISSPYGSITSAVASVTVDAPVISVQPAAQTIAEGGNATFSVSVSGLPPLNYAWYLNGPNLVQSGPGNSLILPAVYPANAGNYTVVVGYGFGSVTSPPVPLTLALPPAVLAQPASQAGVVGTSVAFSVIPDSRNAGPFTYQWQFNGTNLPNGVITTVAGKSGGGTYAGDGGAATNANLYNPRCVALDAAGNQYIADFNNNRIRKVAANGIISTVAGDATTGYGGDGGAATGASLHLPFGVAVDAAGNLYIADEENNRIRKVGANGVITTVAGNGTAAYAGDDGAATNASLYYPRDVALDAAGNLYIADSQNHRIRKVTPYGIISTVAGNGAGKYAGDGGPAVSASLDLPQGVALDSSGNLYIADTDNNRIRLVSPNGLISTVAGNGTGAYASDGGPATNASLYLPAGVALDGYGNVWIADEGNNRVRQVNSAGTITTLAGNGTGAFAGDGGAATTASLYNPWSVTADAWGNMYVADSENNRIRQVSLDAGNPTFKLSQISAASAGNYSVVITNAYGSVTSVVATLTVAFPPAISVQPTNLVALVGGSPTLAVAVTGTAPLAYSWYFNNTNLLQSGPGSTLTLATVLTNNAGNYSVVITNAFGSVTSTVAALTVISPFLITVPPASQTVLAGSSPAFSTTVAGSGPFNYAWYFGAANLLQSGPASTLTLPGVTASSAGNYSVVITNIYGSLTSSVASLTVVYPPTITTPPVSQTVPAGTTVNFNVTAGGTGPLTYQWQFNGTHLPASFNLITTVAGNGNAAYAGDNGVATNASLNYPIGLAFDESGNLWIADSANNRLRQVTPGGLITTAAGTGAAAYAGDRGAATNASLNYPESVVQDAAGNFYIADSLNNRVRKVATNGLITTVAGNGAATYAGDRGAATNASLNQPEGVALDASGNLYIADCLNDRIRMVNSNGIITTVAGSTNSNFVDGIAATNASLSTPTRIAFDPAGNLYIADSGHQRVRKVATNGIITTVAGNGAGPFAFSGDGGAATNASLAWPAGVALDGTGNLYIADNFNHRIRRVNTNGIITTVAGNSPVSGRFTGGYAGDGGPPASATLYAPNSLVFDASGNLLFTDSGNNRIRKLWLNGAYPTLAFNPVTATNAGNYSVIITNPYGSVTSSIVTLTITIPATPPQIAGSGASFGFHTNQFGFNLTGAFGQTIVVDGSTNLINWTPLFTNTANGSPFYFADPAGTNYPWRFYRARLQ